MFPNVWIICVLFWRLFLFRPLNHILKGQKVRCVQLWSLYWSSELTWQLFVSILRLGKTNRASAPLTATRQQKGLQWDKITQTEKRTRGGKKRCPAAPVVANQHAWHLWHGTGAGRRVTPSRLLPSMLRILQLPDTTQLPPSTSRASQRVSLQRLSKQSKTFDSICVV